MNVTIKEHLALEKIAQEQNIYYAPTKYGYPLVILQSEDHKYLEEYKKLFGGRVDPQGGGPGSRYGDIRGPAGVERGYYRWSLQDHEAYLFCKKILSYLAKHDKYRYSFCQELIMRYMENENHRHQQTKP